MRSIREGMSRTMTWQNNLAVKEEGNTLPVSSQSVNLIVSYEYPFEVGKESLEKKLKEEAK